MQSLSENHGAQAVGLRGWNSFPQPSFAMARRSPQFLNAGEALAATRRRLAAFGHARDITVRDGLPERLAVVEMKRGFNLDLLQAVERMRFADEVWLAIPATGRGRDRDPRIRRLCRLIGFGLMAIHGNGRVEVLAEPGPYRPRPDRHRRAKMLSEHARRVGDPTPGERTAVDEIGRDAGRTECVIAGRRVDVCDAARRRIMREVSACAIGW
jgi:hypothetical protein